MGRRKIEIRPIKDDRNRSITFLKRKGGLFKKAYELSVLCSVDVAVIIFGHNKKLYEFSSGDIHETVGRFQYYAGAHEHKGLQDFAGKGGGDDDDDDEEILGSIHGDSHSPPETKPMPHNLHNQPGLQQLNVRHATPSASPPMPNGSFVHRVSTPQPQGYSRPTSRTSHLRRMSSNLAIPQHHTPPPAPMGQPNYAYTPNPPFYNPQSTAYPQRPPTQPPHTQAHKASYPPPSTTHAQVQHTYLYDQRRQSVPPAFPSYGQQSQPTPPRQSTPQPPQQHRHEPVSRRASPQANPGAFTSPPLPQPKPLAAHSKSHSIFTPIEDSRSLLAQHWGAPPEVSQGEAHVKQEENRHQGFDLASVVRNRANGATSQPPQQVTFVHHPPPPQRTASTSSMTSGPPPPSRSSTTQSDAKRPRLKVQIPSEQSDGGEATAESSTKDTASAGPSVHQGKPVVLPPPSPSTNNPLLSAGATGPPNPFARPAPPVGNNSHVNRDHIETPLSALPSRVMDGQMLPSPSDLWQSAWFRSENNNLLPSPLNFGQTPVVSNGPSFRDDAEADRKRRAEVDADNARKRTRN